jgi:carboxyl-terminal processing protease
MSEDQPRGASSWLGAVVAGAILAGFVHAGPLGPARRAPGATVDEVKALIRTHYVHETDDRELEWSALRGMAASLDPYSTFLPPEEAHAFRDDTDGALSGIGIEITVDEKGYLRVIAPLEDSPAWRAGILPGDRIIEIDGKPHEVKHADEAARLIKGRPDTTVSLTVVHEGSQKPEELKILRQKISVPSVKRPRIVDGTPGVGYVRITQFGSQTAEQLHAAVEKLVAKGLKALVLDLRSNPGGLLKEAVEVADLFIESGVIVRTKARDPAQSATYEAKGPGKFLFPVAVLVNGGSASASEIVAGALKDSGRAAIVGTRTYGKGVVQSVFALAPVEEGGEPPLLKLTTARYFTRSNRQIQRELGAKETDAWGIDPDVRVELDPRRLLQIFHKRDALDAHDAGAGTAQIEVPDDPQLDAAVKLLEDRLAAPATAGTK